MKPVSIVTAALGCVLVLVGIFFLVVSRGGYGIVPLAIGATLVYLGFRPGRTSLAVFGHTCIIIGCVLVTLGIYLLPYSRPSLGHVFFRPLFWGMFSILGGVCANYHAFCNCIKRRPAEKL
ncbi:MAG: hypothetical protein ABIL25_06375 [candidate division WOR-3 bacterium]